MAKWTLQHYFKIVQSQNKKNRASCFILFSLAVGMVPGHWRTAVAVMLINVTLHASRISSDN